MQPFLKLPFAFDPAHLQADLGQIAADEWQAHFNRPYYEGLWSGVSLRSVGGKNSLYPDPTATDYLDTPVLARCPYIQTVLATFECPLTAVRFLKLDAGSNIREHKDYNLGFEDGEFRVHVPVITHPDVQFFLAGERVPMAVGECWYLNFNLPHRVENRSPIDRVHLVIDGTVNAWARAVFGADEE